MANIVILLLLLVSGYFVGSHFEKRHYKKIQQKEKELANIAVITGEWKSHINDDEEAILVGTGIVIGSDYFKTFVSGLINIFGGRMTVFESLLDRGRRDVTVKVKEKAKALNAHKIVNFRLETSSIGNAVQGKNGLPCVELFGYGTAIRKKSNV